MSLVYAVENSSRSIHILCTHPGNLRERIPPAWDEGQSQIPLSDIPQNWGNARALLISLQEYLTQATSERTGSAAASVYRKQDHTLMKIAEMMMSLDAMLETALEESIQKAKT